MLENERIIVQDRGGIDAGIAALMQNANKGFDPAALMAMMNNGNGMFGGNGGWWWIFIIVLFWMWGGWGGNGFGRGNQAETNSDFARLAARCEDILKILNINSDITTNVTKDFKELDDLKAEVKELKQLLQNVSAVRPEVIKNTPPNSAEDKKVEPEGEIKKEI